MNYEDLLELVKARRSTRAFKADPVSDDQVEQILEVARWAPSGTNSQPWEFVVVRNKEARETLERLEMHLAANEVDLKKTPAVLGPWLTWDSNREEFVGDFPASWANKLLRRGYREPFVVPGRV